MPSSSESHSWIPVNDHSCKRDYVCGFFISWFCFWFIHAFLKFTWLSIEDFYYRGIVCKFPFCMFQVLILVLLALIWKIWSYIKGFHMTVSYQKSAVISVKLTHKFSVLMNTWNSKFVRRSKTEDSTYKITFQVRTFMLCLNASSFVVCW